MFRHNFFQLTLSLLDVSINKIWGKLEKNEPDLKWWTPQASPASPHRRQDIENSLSEPCKELRPRPWKGSNKPFTQKNFLKLLIWSTGLPRRRSPVEIAATWRYRLPIINFTPHYNIDFEL